MMLNFVFWIIVLIVIHELGHYLAARAVGVVPVAFSVGFGRELFGRTDENGTRWKFSAIPLGGYVMFDETLESAPVWKKSLIAISGPIFNFLTAGILLAFAAYFYVEGHSVFSAIKVGFIAVFSIIGMVVAGLLEMDVSNFTGPVGIGSQYAGASDYMSILLLSSAISIGMGVMNLIPLPGLDGGQLVFHAYEAVFRKPVNKVFAGCMTLATFSALIVFGIYIGYLDIIKITH